MRAIYTVPVDQVLPPDKQVISFNKFLMPRLFVVVYHQDSSEWVVIDCVGSVGVYTCQLTVYQVR